MEKTDSPCNGICIIDEDTGLCVGCLRTSEEIAVWQDCPEERKREILREIKLREEEAQG